MPFQGIDAWNTSTLKSLMPAYRQRRESQWRQTMPLRVSGRNISIGAALQRKITDRVEEATSKYFRGGYSGHDPAEAGRRAHHVVVEVIRHRQVLLHEGIDLLDHAMR